MNQNMIRLLRADEIECRVSIINEKGLGLLLYKDARVDQKILDETFGPFGWQRRHQNIDGNLYCTVEIYDKENGFWVAKQDVGTTGYTEKEKSQASDSFKRACFNWGIGRELYSAPFIWIYSADAEIRKKDGKFYCNDRFSVESISYNTDREIASLFIINDSKKGKRVYEFCSRGAGQSGQTRAEKEMPESRRADAITEKQMRTLETELKRTGVGIEAVKSRYGFEEPQKMSEELYSRVMQALAKTKSAAERAA